MARIGSKALTLGACLWIAACGGGTPRDASGPAGAQKGKFGVFYVVSVSRPVGGHILSDDGRIDCGTAGTGHDRCDPVSYDWGRTTTFSAYPDAGLLFQSWAADCGSAVALNGCTLDTDGSGADKWIAAIFNPPDQIGHARIPDPAQHAPLFYDFANHVPGAPACTRCHGQDYRGLANAPSCVGCHEAGARKGLRLAVTSVTRTAAGVAVAFTARDDGGRAVDLAAAGIAPRFGLASFTRNAATGVVGPYQVRTLGADGPGLLAPPAPNAPASAATGGLTGTPGSYAYVFPPSVTLDPARLGDTHVVWIQASRQEDGAAATAATFTAVNAEFNFVPGAVDVPVTAASAVRRQVVSSDACGSCHDGFRPRGTGVAGTFHGGEAVEAPFCAVCHNAESTRTLEGTLHGIWRGSAAQFVHSIHGAAKMGLPATESFAGIRADGYPRPVADCTACHAAGAAQGNQWKTRPTIEACGSCHPTYPFPHSGGGACEGCHTPYGIEVAHVPYVPRDRGSVLETAGGNTRTNASALNGAGQVVAGGSTLQAILRDVTVSATGRPVITFKLTRTTPNPDGTAAVADVVFNPPPAAPDASRELMDDYVGTLGVYVVLSLPQDGIARPADFNASVRSDLKLAWMNVGGSGVSATSLSGPVDGWYAITFPNLVIPAEASNLTAGLGYAYDLPGTQPLTQISVGGSAWSRFTPYEVFDAPVTSGTVFGQACTVAAPCRLKRGGVVAPIRNVWKSAGTPRRRIVDTALCDACHGRLGVDPTFHVGQRNDAPSCSFCHNPNQNKGGWSSNASTFVHAIHGGARRTVDYGWTATCPAGSTWNATSARCEDGITRAPVKAGFAAVDYPRSPAGCGACHAEGTDSQALAGVEVGDLLWTTVASGAMAASTGPSQSPYVEPGKDYGVKWSATLAAGGAAPTIVPAAGTTLVSSPVAAACFSCHDDSADHIRAMGGSLYRVRSTVDTARDVETCLDCHGAGKIFDVVRAHR